MILIMNLITKLYCAGGAIVIHQHVSGVFFPQIKSFITRLLSMQMNVSILPN